MKEDKSKPNPDWVSVPHGLAHGMELRNGKWVKFTWMMKDGKIAEMPEGSTDLDESDGRPPEEHEVDE